MFEFKLPEIGEGVVEGEILRWLKTPGDSVTTNEPLLEVMTDKATVEIPSPVSGIVVEVSASEGDICSVGSRIANIDTEGTTAAVPAPAQAVAVTKPAPPVEPKAETDAVISDVSDTSILATPAARAFARQKGVNLRDVPTDSSGRITKSAVVEYAQRPAPEPVAPEAPIATQPSARPGLVAIPPSPQQSLAFQPPSAGTAPVPISPAAHGGGPLSPPNMSGIPTQPLSQQSARPAVAPAHAAAPVAPTQPVQRMNMGANQPDEYIPFRGMRRVIAESLSQSWAKAVHFTFVDEANVSKLVKLRTEAKASAAAQGVSLNYLPFVIKAVIHGLRKFPIVNATLDETAGQIVVRKRFHIGIAVATPGGLSVPVIRDADQLSILDLAREIARLSESVRSGTATKDELTGGTFTISSLGAKGGLHATPIINFPEVGILGIHAIRKTPVFDENDNVVPAHIMNLSGSFDHRIVDGFEGASFVQEVANYLQDPTLLFLAGI